jgi:hypothetical protein
MLFWQLINPDINNHAVFERPFTRDRGIYVIDLSMMAGTGCHLAVLTFAKTSELQDSCGEGVNGR